MIVRHQHEHEAINAREYPGARQLCSLFKTSELTKK